MLSIQYRAIRVFLTGPLQQLFTEYVHADDAALSYIGIWMFEQITIYPSTV